MFLKEYHEIVGSLKQVILVNNLVKLIFSFDKEIEIPENAISADTLKEMVGDKVGIFNSGDGRFRIRKIK